MDPDAEVFLHQRRRWVILRPLWLAAAAMALAACGGGDPDNTGEAVPSSTLAQGNTGIQTVAHYVVRDAAAWSELWALHASRFPGAPPARPVVDFQTHMVVGTYAGVRNLACFSLEIDRVLQDGTRSTVVRYREIGPAPGAACATALTDLFFLARVPASPGPVEFQKVN